jgi:hypothetical protein
LRVHVSQKTERKFVSKSHSFGSGAYGG